MRTRKANTPLSPVKAALGRECPDDVKIRWLSSERSPNQVRMGTVRQDQRNHCPTTIVKAITEIKAITETLLAVIATDSMSTQQKVEKQMWYADCIDLIREDSIKMLKWIFCLGHAGRCHRTLTLSGELRRSTKQNDDGQYHAHSLFNDNRVIPPLPNKRKREIV